MAFGTVDDRNIFHLLPRIDGRFVDWKLIRSLDVSKTMPLLARHRAYVENVPQSVGAWIRLSAVEEYTDKPRWFLIEVMRSSWKARFQIMSSCNADEDPSDLGTL